MRRRRVALVRVLALRFLEMPDEDAAAVEPLIEPDELAVLDEEVLAAPATLGSARIGEELGDIPLSSTRSSATETFWPV